MKLTKYGFRLNLIGFASFLSWLGIVTSLLGIIGGIVAIIIVTTVSDTLLDPTLKIIIISIWSILLLFSIPYLVMWGFLRINTDKRDIKVIETIARIYCYVIGALEIIISICGMASSVILIIMWQVIAVFVGTFVGSTVYLFFASLKIHGIRRKQNKLLGIYLFFRYFCILLILPMILSILSMIISPSRILITNIGPIIFFILDMGLNIILHSIRANRNTVGLLNSEENNMGSGEDNMDSGDDNMGSSSSSII